MYVCHIHMQWQFLGASAKMRKATPRLVMSVRLSVCPHVTTRLSLDEFSCNLILQNFSNIFRKKIYVSLKLDKNVGYFTRRPTYTLITSRSILLRMRHIWDKVVEKNKTQILYCYFFFFENRAVNVIMWKNMVQPDRPQVTIGRTRIACWITRATHTHDSSFYSPPLEPKVSPI